MKRALSLESVSVSNGGEEWTTVHKKTKGFKAPPTLTVLQSKTQHTVPNSNKTSIDLNKFEVLPTEGRSSYAAVVALEQQHPGIQLNAKPNPRGYYILTPKNQDTFQTLQNKATELNMQELNPMDKTHKVVLQKYPLEMSLGHILKHPQVKQAQRCTYSKEK